MAAEESAPVSSEEVERFVAGLELRYVSGSGDSNLRSIAGWLTYPVCEGAVLVPRDLIFGLYLEGPDQGFDWNKAELLREAIRSALAGWAPCGP
jgi:hypothetical protein